MQLVVMDFSGPMLPCILIISMLVSQFTASVLLTAGLFGFDMIIFQLHDPTQDGQGTGVG